MFTLENITKLKGTLLAISLAVLVTGCNETTSNTVSKNESSVDGAVKYPIKDNKYTQYHVNTQKLDGLNIGRDATKKEITAWNKDVMYEGTGLPEFDMHEGEVVLEDGKPKKAQGSVELEMNFMMLNVLCVMEILEVAEKVIQS